MADPMDLTEVLDQLDKNSSGEKISLGNMIESLGGRGYGPLLLAVALVLILPTGLIPGIPTTFAAVILILSIQLALGRDSPWVPQKLKRKEFDKHKFETARDKIKPVTQKIDYAIKPRLHPLTTPLVARAIGALCVLIAISIPPLELIPFAGFIPALAVAFFAIGLSGKDGLFIAVGLVMSAAVAAGVFYWFS